jgi:hypothetical protein
VPGSVVEEAVFAGAGYGSFGVVVRVLIEWDCPDGMLVAEYIATAPAVVSSIVEVKVSCALLRSDCLGRMEGRLTVVSSQTSDSESG